VAKKSLRQTTSSLRLPGSMTPGQRRTRGTRRPLVDAFLDPAEMLAETSGSGLHRSSITRSGPGEGPRCKESSTPSLAPGENHAQLGNGCSRELGCQPGPGGITRYGDHQTDLHFSPSTWPHVSRHFRPMIATVVASPSSLPPPSANGGLLECFPCHPLALIQPSMFNARNDRPDRCPQTVTFRDALTQPLFPSRRATSMVFSQVPPLAALHPEWERTKNPPIKPLPSSGKPPLVSHFRIRKPLNRNPKPENRTAGDISLGTDIITAGGLTFNTTGYSFRARKSGECRRCRW
jgi:hypothetical protein